MLAPNHFSNPSMKSLGKRAAGLRLERMRASRRLERRRIPQPPSGAAGTARPTAPVPVAARLPLRRRTARALETAAGDESARRVAPAGRQRPARHMARSLDGADRDRWSARADRSGVGTARLALAAGRSEALPAGAGAAAHAAAARPGAGLARPLRPPRLPDDPRARASTQVPFVTSLGVGAHLEAWGVPPERIVELDWWESYTLPNAELACTPRRRSTSRGAGSRTATPRCGRRW